MLAEVGVVLARDPASGELLAAGGVAGEGHPDLGEHVALYRAALLGPAARVE